MIIDCHTHIGRNEHINKTVDELLASMDEAKIDKSLVFAGKLNDIDNLYLLKQIAPHRDRLYGVACCHLEDDGGDAFILERLIDEQSIVAVKFYLGYDHWYPGAEKMRETLSFMNERKMTAIFHCGDCLNSVKCAKLRYAQPLGVDDVAVDYPDMNFVIAHVGYPWHRDTAEVCYKNTNVYTDVSGFVYNSFTPNDVTKFYKTLNEFNDISSNEKLLFGSDWPISNQKSYVEVCQGALMPDSFSKQIEKVFNLT